MKDVDKKKIRYSNIDLLKIFMMIGVVVLHYNNESIGKAILMTPVGSTKSYAIFFLQSIFICAVNVFMLISGYLMAEYKRIELRKPIRLLIQVIVFREVVYIIQMMDKDLPLDGETMRWWLLPQSYFAVLYICVYILSPYINKLMSLLDEKKLTQLMTVLFIMFSVWPFMIDYLQRVKGKSLNQASTIGMFGSQSGYTIVNFMLMYMIGAYIKRINKEYKMWKCLLTLGASWILIFVLAYEGLTEGFGYSLAYEYCNPMVIISATTMFIVFNKIKIPSSKILSSLSKATFSVYLLNSTLILEFSDTKKYVNESGYVMLGHIALTCISVCLVCWAVQILYDLITMPIYKFIDKRTKKHIIISAE